jgi:hypothetical protein
VRRFGAGYVLTVFLARPRSAALARGLAAVFKGRIVPGAPSEATGLDG